MVDKPAGPTSHDVVARVRWLLGTRAVGHTGTLDPFATGLLIVLVGRGTRLARFVEAQPKTYLATARLGVRTETDDLTGAVVGAPVDVDAIPMATVREALAEFLGSSLQRPPSYSAKRIAGERSYARARRGETVALADVAVTVHAIELVAYTPPEVTFRATVSAGTYLRAIARDLGERLGVGAHLVTLRREAIGAVRVEDAVPLDRLGLDAVVPVQRVLGHLSTVTLSEAERRAVVHGRLVMREPAAAETTHGVRAPSVRTPKATAGTDADDAEAAGYVVLEAGGRVVAIATPNAGGWQPVVVLERTEDE